MAFPKENLSKDLAARRLREARASKFATAAEAARELGLKEVTVRAHESGQNRFNQGHAARYADAYGVPAAWLLFGDTDDRAGLDGMLGRMTAEMMDIHSDRGRRIPVRGEIENQAFRPDGVSFGPDPRSFLNIVVSGYELSTRCFAMEVTGEGTPPYEPGRFVIVGDLEEAGVRPNDHVVIAVPHAGLIEITIAEAVVVADKPAELRRLDGRGAYQLDQVAMLGPIIADYRRRDRSAPGLKYHSA